MNKISIHRALSELKIIDSRIDNATQSVKFAQAKDSDNLIEQQHVEEYNAKVKSSLQSVLALIGRKIALKQAIQSANAITIVEIAGKSMTIADAIAYKDIIDLQSTFRKKIKRDLDTAQALISTHNYQIEKHADELAKTALGSDGSAKPEDVQAIRQPYIDKRQLKLADPIQAVTLIEEMSTQILDFTTDVDASLSEINAITMIEV